MTEGVFSAEGRRGGRERERCVCIFQFVQCESYDSVINLFQQWVFGVTSDILKNVFLV